ncbi:hypothetical protein THAOC_15455, partial [Thalassiosira oceanica]
RRAIPMALRPPLSIKRAGATGATANSLIVKRARPAEVPMGCHARSRKTAHTSTVTKVPTKTKKNEQNHGALGRGELLHNHEPPSNGGWQH